MVKEIIKEGKSMLSILFTVFGVYVVIMLLYGIVYFSYLGINKKTLIEENLSVIEFFNYFMEEKPFEVEELIQGKGNFYNHVDKTITMSGDLNGRKISDYATLFHELGHGAQSKYEKLSTPAAFITILLFISSIISHVYFLSTYTTLNFFGVSSISFVLGFWLFKIITNLYYETSANYHGHYLLKRYGTFLSVKEKRIIFVELFISYLSYVIPLLIYMLLIYMII
jgi:hypothetical protein